MSKELKPPIFLFGNTRSGTTIVQKVVAQHPEIVGWYEPNPVWLYADPGRIYDEFDRSDATDKVKKYIRNRFYKYQKQNDNCTVFEKTPQNIFRIPYVKEIFPEATFIYIVRDPFSFISSVELKWQKTVTGTGIKRRLKDTPMSQVHYWAKRYLIQQFYKKVLGRKYLSIWGPRYFDIYGDLKKYDLLKIIARQWAVGSQKAEKGFSQIGDTKVLRLKYENFVNDPIPELERICSHCKIELTDEMIMAANNWVKSDRQNKWKRFNPRELAGIVSELKEEMQRNDYELPTEIATEYQRFNANNVNVIHTFNQKATKTN